MVNELADAIAKGNDQKFNASRGAKPYIGDAEYSGLDLAKFNFNDTLFDGIRFTKCRFEDMKSVRFTKCTFDRCTFDNSDTKSKEASYDVLAFHDCQINRTKLSIRVKDLTLVKTCFWRVDFKNAVFSSSLRVENCIGFSQSANLRYSAIKVEDIVYEGNDPAWYWQITSWEGLRFILSIPVTKISWLLFIAHAAILGLAYVTVHAAESLGPAAIKLHPDVALYLSMIRPWIAESAFLQSVSQNILLSLVLLLGSILFTYACPKEIKGYDRQQWMYELNQNGFVYEHISFLRGPSRFFACAFVAIALGFLAYKYARPVGETAFRLVDLAVNVQQHRGERPADAASQRTHQPTEKSRNN